MKKLIVTLTLSSTLLISCQKNEEQGSPSTTKEHATNTKTPKSGVAISSIDYFITPASANLNIKSYLDGIDTFSINQLKSLFINADALRAYLDNTDIVEIKLLLGHTNAVLQSKTNEVDTFVYLNQGAVTAYIVGVDAYNNYVYYDNELIINNTHGCPNECKATGTASADLLIGIEP